MKVKIVFVLGAFLFFSCTSNEARRPVSKSKTSILEASVTLNKKLTAVEERYIQAYILKDTLHTYKKSEEGFWYAYVKENKEETYFPKKGDVVFFEEEIRSLNGKILYSKEELGVKEYFVDKEHIIRGVKEGIKLMKEGEEVIFVFSSFVAYRMHGDKKNRIGINEPIVSQIKLININKN